MKKCLIIAMLVAGMSCVFAIIPSDNFDFYSITEDINNAEIIKDTNIKNNQPNFNDSIKEQKDVIEIKQKDNTQVLKNKKIKIKKNKKERKSRFKNFTQGRFKTLEELGI